MELIQLHVFTQGCVCNIYMTKHMVSNNSILMRTHCSQPFAIPTSNQDFHYTSILQNLQQQF